MAKYTKGEWKVADESYTGDLFIKTIGGKYVALASKNDAYLIAAAPAMYEALRDLAVYVEQKEVAKGKYLDNAFKALAKAEGK